MTHRRGWLLCASQPGAGNQPKAIYRTDDGGRTWRRLLQVGFDGRPSGGLTLGGYAHGIAFARNGVGLLWEHRGTLRITENGGRRWRPLHSVAPPESFGVSAAVVPGRAFALLYQASTTRLVATTRGYRNWTTVRTVTAARS